MNAPYGQVSVRAKGMGYNLRALAPLLSLQVAEAEEEVFYTWLLLCPMKQSRMKHAITMKCLRQPCYTICPSKEGWGHRKRILFQSILTVMAGSLEKCAHANVCCFPIKKKKHNKTLKRKTG